MFTENEKIYHLNKISIGKILNQSSKQVEDDKTYNIISPSIDFRILLEIYENSYMVWGITDKVMSSCVSGFEIWSTENTDWNNENELLKILDETQFDFLFKNLLACWNAFFEVIRNIDGDVVELLPVLTDQVKVLQWWEWFIQRLNSKTVFFNSFTPKEDRAEREKVRQASEAKNNELKWQPGGAGFNPNLNEIRHFKQPSLRTKYYWDTPFNKVLTQILLLENIDKFYMQYFDNGTIKAKIIKSKSWSLSPQQAQEIQEALKKYMSWINNAFEMIVINDDIEAINLSDDIDTEAFLKYREQLEQSVCVGLNLPFDIIKSTNSNRSTAEVAIEIMNKQLTVPLQKAVNRDLKKIFSTYKDIQSLKFIPIDTKDQKEQAEVMATLLDRDVITRYEARQSLWYSKRDKDELDQFVWSDTPNPQTLDWSNNLDNTEDDVAKLYEKDNLKKEPDSKKKD